MSRSILLVLYFSIGLAGCPAKPDTSDTGHETDADTDTDTDTDTDADADSDADADADADTDADADADCTPTTGSWLFAGGYPTKDSCGFSDSPGDMDVDLASDAPGSFTLTLNSTKPVIILDCLLDGCDFACAPFTESVPPGLSLTVTIEGAFSSNVVGAGTMAEGLDCKGVDCGDFGIPFPCEIIAPFDAAYRP
jgi:hypothetical protein